MSHDWITTRALPGRSYDDCRRQGCEAKAIWWDGAWKQTAGPKECRGREG